MPQPIARLQSLLLILGQGNAGESALQLVTQRMVDAAAVAFLFDDVAAQLESLPARRSVVESPTTSSGLGSGWG